LSFAPHDHSCTSSPAKKESRRSGEPSLTAWQLRMPAYQKNFFAEQQWAFRTENRGRSYAESWQDLRPRHLVADG
jgi:hypothetical protein